MDYRPWYVFVLLLLIIVTLVGISFDDKFGLFFWFNFLRRAVLLFEDWIRRAALRNEFSDYGFKIIKIQLRLTLIELSGHELCIVDIARQDLDAKDESVNRAIAKEISDELVEAVLIFVFLEDRSEEQPYMVLFFDPQSVLVEYLVLELLQVESLALFWRKQIQPSADCLRRLLVAEPKLDELKLSAFSWIPIFELSLVNKLFKS